MKTLQNNFTTPEQSKRLLELGLPADSADCYHSVADKKNTYIRNTDETSIFSRDGFIPCWSVGRLIEIYNECNSLADEYKTKYGVNIIEDIIHDFETPFSPTHCIKFDFSKLEE